MKKVLFVILGLDFSGAENVLIQYLDGNSEIDPYFTFIYNGVASVEFVNKFGKDKVRELNLPYNKNELRILPYLAQRKLYKAMRGIIDEIEPDVIYFNNTHEVLLSRVLLKNLKMPSIGHIHDMMYSIGSPAKRYEARKTYEKLDAVLTVSEACKKSWNCEKMKVIYNGVPDAFFCDEQVNECIHEKLTIGYVGMISDRKGFDILAEIIELGQMPVNWKIAYNMIEPKYEETLNKIKTKDNVKVFYKVPSYEIKKFYDSIDILVIPSRQDPLPTVAIEAMARKVLVLGADTGGIPELVGNASFLFEKNNVAALDDLIKRYMAMDKKDLREQVEKQFKYARKHFSNRGKREAVNSILNNLLVGDDK